MEEKQNSEHLDREQVLQVLEFADMVYNPASYQNKLGIYNPQILNQNLVDLNNSPIVPTYDKIIKALKDVTGNVETLQGYSEWMQWTDSIYSKILGYYKNILSFDYYYDCINVKNKEEWKSDEYKNDVKRVDKWLDSFDCKREFKKVVDQVLRTNISFVWLRDNNNEEYPQRALQIMPQDYCRITGNSSICPLYDLDMGYFLKAGTSLDLYPDIFKKYYNDIFKGKGYKNYNPANSFSRRNGSFAYYHQTSIEDGAYCFMFNDGNFNAIPPFSFLLRSTVMNPEIERLQYDKDLASAYSLLVGEIKTFSGAKTGEKPDQFAISPLMLGNFLASVQSGLKRNVRPIAMPTEDNKHFQFVDQNPKMYGYKLEESANQGVSAGSLIYSTSKASQEESRNQIITDGNIMKNLYRQFEAFLNFYVNKKTRKYKFRFHFDGLDYPFERKQRIDTAFQFADKGFVLNESYYASLMGIQPQVFRRMLEEGHNGCLTENLTTLLNINTMKSGGAPEKSSSDITESGATSRDYGSYN